MLHEVSMYDKDMPEDLVDQVNTSQMSTNELEKHIEDLTKELNLRREEESNQVLAEIKDRIKHYKELQPSLSDIDLATKLGFKLTSTNKDEKQSTQKRKQAPHFYYVDDDGIAHQTGSSSPRSLKKSPWRELIEKGSINEYAVQYVQEADGEVRYWTNLNKSERPDDAKAVNRNGVNIERLKESIERMI